MTLTLTSLAVVLFSGMKIPFFLVLHTVDTRTCVRTSVRPKYGLVFSFLFSFCSFVVATIYNAERTTSMEYVLCQSFQAFSQGLTRYAVYSIVIRGVVVTSFQVDRLLFYSHSSSSSSSSCIYDRHAIHILASLVFYSRKRSSAGGGQLNCATSKEFSK